MRTKEGTNMSEPWIVVSLQQLWFAIFLCIHSHTAELIDVKGFSVQSYSLLPIDDR